MDSLWETPKRSVFLDNIVKEIYSGKITLVFLPKHAPKGFLQQLKLKFEKRNQIKYRKIDLDNCENEGNKPIESFLFSDFDLDENTQTFIPQNAASIFRHIDFNVSKIFVFENLPYVLVDQFREFIIELGHYLTGNALYERHKVIVLLDAENFKMTDFTSESGIQKIMFQGVFDKLDNILILRYYYNYQNNGFTSLYENIMSMLSVFDYRLTETLVECDNLIEDYNEQLNIFAREQKWDIIKYKGINKLSEEEIWYRWSKGILEKSNGTYIYHSAFLKIHNKDAEIKKRIWQSGVEVLIPLIEEFRDVILKSDKIHYPDVFPSKKNGDPINSKIDLEIGSIYHFVNKQIIHIRWLSVGEKGKVKAFIKICREIRNDLSHLKIPTVDNIEKFFQEYDEVKRLLRTND
ncbi:hypothetical protein BMS3Abin03_01352 [bacterium BMS3Abin03]|nr:hypothetical protein BMS3Abin03_01352 [bacterium BMS3Abin03]